MKSALIPTLVTWACLAIVSNNATAQYQYSNMAPTGSSATPANNNNNVATDENSLFANNNNGLWDNSAVCGGCSICGGGSNCPPSWYTRHGTVILSRSATRNVPVSKRSPSTGTYTAMADPNNPTEYYVHNNVTAFVTYPSGAVGYPIPSDSAAFNLKEFGPDVAAGYDMTIGHHFCRDRNNNDHFIEFAFWGFNSWLAKKTLTGQLVPIYDESIDYDQTLANQINWGETLPIRMQVGGEDVFRGSLSTYFPRTTAYELDGAATYGQTMLNMAFNNALVHSFRYRSTMYNFELNGRISPRGEQDRLVLHPDGRWRRECQPGMYMSYLYGIRLMKIDDTFNFYSSGQGQWGDDYTQETHTTEGRYDVRSRNHLLGLQIGADMTFRQCRWNWSINSKVGPYLNFADQKSYIGGWVTDSDDYDPYEVRFADSRTKAAFIGEIGIEASYKFRPNLVGHAGYNIMWITSLALAPEQMQFTADPIDRVNVNGGIFSQGLRFGLEWLW